MGMASAQFDLYIVIPPYTTSPREDVLQAFKLYASA